MLASPSIHPSVFIGPNVAIWGDVTLDREVVVLPGVVMRAELAAIRVGAQSNLQDNSVFHVDEGFPLTLGERVTVGHRAVLHGCTVGDDALIGIGAIVMNGASIGAGSLVAAGSLVTEGKVFPERSLLVGSPAKVLREVTDEEAARTRSGVDHYLDFARMFREAGLG
ncbi:MAG: gamma carbonic anhydrase family protein [Acidimicrobiia bacterium]|nr:gamma carbonic anhydrase family protein [Acidimicrobiia bacterium]